MQKIIEKKLPFRVEKNIKFFIKSDHYSDTFGKQWNRFSYTQIDNSGNNHSYTRFFRETGMNSEDFDKKNILEIGSGAGRFTNIILIHTNAFVYSVDSSDAVFANYENNQNISNGRLNLYKASIYDLPFERNQFDIVICLGVLQHTPDPVNTIKCLCEQVKKNGKIIVDFYPYNGFWTLISAKYFLRPLTSRLSVNYLFNFYKEKIPKLIKLYYFFKKNKLGVLTRFLPIADISNTIPENLEKSLFEEMVLLDTIDMLSPKYDKPQKLNKIKKLIQNQNFNITFAGKIKYDPYSSTVVRGIKN